MAALREALRILARASAPRQGEMNALRMFAGPMAKTADKQALSRAQEMAGQGATRDAIWRDTGWFQGVDGKWRFEIDDSGATLTGAPQRPSYLDYDRLTQQLHGVRSYGYLPFGEPGSLGPMRQSVIDAANAEISPNAETLAGQLDHPELFDAYPELADLRIQVGSATGPGNGNWDGQRIWLDSRDDLSGMLHETTHAGPQTTENFARGGSPENVLQGELDALNGRLSRIVTEQDHWRSYANNGPQFKAEADRNLAALREEYNALISRREVEFSPTRRREAYRRLAGETEARNVQSRMRMSAEERRARAPWETQDVPDDQQIVRFDGDRASNALGDMLRVSAGLGGVALAGDITLRELLRERRANRANPSA